jgi:hypothetical protein
MKVRKVEMLLKRTMLIAIACVGLWISAASASPFVNPPEQNPMIPAGGWIGVFPYQRNAKIDFTTDPATWPEDQNVPGKTELHPDINYDLEGTDDPVLYPSDWCDSAGDVLWYDQDPTGAGRQGLIGFFGEPIAGGTLIWHLDNWPDPNRYKFVYLEAELYVDGLGIWNAGVEAAPPAVVGYDSMEVDVQDLGSGWYRVNIWIPIEPNPLWEELYLMIGTEPNGIETGGQEVVSDGVLASSSVLIDYVHVATECVPEPATLSLLALGGVMLITRRKR